MQAAWPELQGQGRHRGSSPLVQSVPPLLPPRLPADSPAIRAALGVPAGASNDEAFGAIRSAKDTFR